MNENGHSRTIGKYLRLAKKECKNEKETQKIEEALEWLDEVVPQIKELENWRGIAVRRIAELERQAGVKR